MTRLLAILAMVLTGIVGSQQSVIGSSAAGAPATVTHVAVAINGSIVLFRASGGGRIQLTHSGRDSGPVVSPDGRKIAFFRAVGGSHQDVRNTLPYDSMMARPDGHGGYRVSTFSQRPAVLTMARHVFAWQPRKHGFGLAWFSGNTVQYRRVFGSQQTVLRVGLPSPYYGDSAITFARDGSAIAAAPVAPMTSPSVFPQTLRIAVRQFGGNGEHIVTVRFRPGTLRGHSTRLGSVPVGTDLTYTDLGLPVPLHTLEFPVVRVGAGYQITGVFLVPDIGGVAHLFLGNGHGIHGMPPFGPGMNEATQFLYSPNDKYVATDPNNNLWISGAVDRSRMVHVPRGVSCVLAQWTWLSDSQRLAYVTACTIAGNNSIPYRLTLGTVSRFGGRATVLATRETSDLNAMDLAPSIRCIACG